MTTSLTRQLVPNFGISQIHFFHSLIVILQPGGKTLVRGLQKSSSMVFRRPLLRKCANSVNLEPSYVHVTRNSKRWHCRASLSANSYHRWLEGRCRSGIQPVLNFRVPVRKSKPGGSDVIHAWHILIKHVEGRPMGCHQTCPAGYNSPS